MHKLAFYIALQLELHLILLVQEFGPPFVATTSLLHFIPPLTNIALHKSYNRRFLILSLLRTFLFVCLLIVCFLRNLSIGLRISFMKIPSIWLWKAKGYWDVVFHSREMDFRIS